MSNLPTSRSVCVLSKGRVACERCEIPLSFGLRAPTFHTTWYSANLALSPLCDFCWAALALAERIHYYRIRWTYVSQAQGHSPDTAAQLWEQIRRAVISDSKQ